jgi:hypothetical protein
MGPNDRQLRDLLREWQTPGIPPALEERVLRPPRSWPRFLLRGYIRVPVPVACCLIALLLFAGWRVAIQPAQSAPCVADCKSSVAGAC